MAKRKSSENLTGSTFADLYNIQEELKRQGSKPMGRPPKKVQRKPTTVYLTKDEQKTLRRMELILNEFVSVNRSEIMGVALEVLNTLLATAMDDEQCFHDLRSPEDLKPLFNDMIDRIDAK